MPARRQRSEDATINLTPMIDVVFLLVIFFMVGSKFSEAESRIKVNVPTVGELRSITRVPDERIVVIGMDGALSLDGQPITLEQLTATLREQHRVYPAIKVAVRGEAEGTLQQTVEVLHAVRSSGVDQIGISTRRMQR
ncbi:MAG: biopolymer transporter ExbD [Pirellulales bacterium]|nr:biopolymer transporter ExbD [Pirellulales bacterium]